MRVGDIMTRNPVTVKRADSLGTLLKVLSTNRITGCPVVDGRKKVVGVVGHTDVLRFVDVHNRINDGKLSSFVSALVRKGDIDPKKLKDAKVGDFFTEGAITIDHEDHVYNAARLMSENGINRLPVVMDRKLVGIVTKTDIMKFLEKSR